VSKLGAVAVAAAVFVHIYTTAAGRAGHTGEEQEDHESEYSFPFHICYNGESGELLFFRRQIMQIERFFQF
jgi:hypothetical protein